MHQGDFMKKKIYFSEQSFNTAELRAAFKYKVQILFVLVTFLFSSVAWSEPIDLYHETSGEGRPIILLHGGPGLDHTYLFPQMGVLSKKYQLITYDQRGSGKSLNTELNDKAINTSVFVEDLESLRKKLGLEKFILMGHSWGGRLAMDYAIRHPEHVESLILIGSAPASKKEFELFDSGKKTKEQIDSTFFDWNNADTNESNEPIYEHEIDELYAKKFGNKELIKILIEKLELSESYGL